MTREFLLPFCFQYDGYVAIQRPFSSGPYSFATNGYLLIRVPRMADVNDEDEVGANRIFEKALMPTEWHPVPNPGPPVFERCSWCGGKNGGCDECDWTGHEEPFTAVRVGDQFFQARYLRLLLRLPGVMIGTTWGINAARVRFDGGDGLIMPCEDR